MQPNILNLLLTRNFNICQGDPDLGRKRFTYDNCSTDLKGTKGLERYIKKKTLKIGLNDTKVITQKEENPKYYKRKVVSLVVNNDCLNKFTITPYI